MRDHQLIDLLPVDVVAPCADYPDLFRSILLYKHYAARELCLSCPLKAGCREVPAGDPHGNGTYGGALFVGGVVRVNVDDS